MPPYALAQAILSPVIAVLFIVLFERIGRVFLKPKTDSPHWTDENRAVYEYALYIRYLSIFGAALASFAFCFNEFLLNSGMVWLLVVLVIFMIALPSYLCRRPLDRWREHLGRVDLKPHRSIVSIGMLRNSVYPFLLCSMAFAPWEFSIELFLWVFAWLAVAVYWNGWGIMQLCCALKVIKPDHGEWERHVAAMAEEQELSETPRTLIARIDMLNAFAYQPGHAVILTSALVQFLSKPQTCSIIDHELGHLKEGKESRILRRLSPLLFTPIILLKPLVMTIGFFEAFLAAFGSYFILARLYAWYSRRKEKAADHHAATVAGDADHQTYADALTVLHKENLLPATFPKSGFLTHPSLFDRLEAMGVTPDFERPAPPRKTKPFFLALGAGVAGIFGMIFGFALIVEAYSILKLW